MPAPAESYPSIVKDIYPGIAPENFKGSNKGRVVFITGASKGLGLESARAYAATGASLFLSARSTDVLQDVKKDIQAEFSVPVEFATVDVMDEESVKKSVEEAVKVFGKIDIVIANAGGSGSAGTIGESLQVSAFWNTIELNLKGSFNVATYTLPELRKSKGYIIFLSSALTQIRLTQGSGYNIGKLTLIRLADWIDVEHGKEGVKAIAMHPGAVATDLVAGLLKRLPHLKGMFSDSPQLGPWTQVRLTSGDMDWLSGRFVDATWNLDEVRKNKELILEDDALKIRLALPHLA